MSGGCPFNLALRTNYFPRCRTTPRSGKEVCKTRVYVILQEKENRKPAETIISRDASDASARTIFSLSFMSSCLLRSLCGEKLYCRIFAIAYGVELEGRVIPNLNQQRMEQNVEIIR